MHECPDCGELCHCSGDIDDIMFEHNEFCIHYRQCQRRVEDDDDDDYQEAVDAQE